MSGRKKFAVRGEKELVYSGCQKKRTSHPTTRPGQHIYGAICASLGAAMPKSQVQTIADPTIPFEEDSGRLCQKREETKRMLASDYSITSAFLRVAVLAKVLGISQPTIYAAIRRGSFFLPFRMLGSMPVVKFDDLVDWYCEPPLTVKADECLTDREEETQRIGSLCHEQGGNEGIEAKVRETPEESGKAIRDEIVAGVLARMRGQSPR
jgi:predicted DNA-binding transcriptional regulator AlpA